jgi:ABC-type spermidine/putrescine transport system permease subunit II
MSMPPARTIAGRSLLDRVVVGGAMLIAAACGLLLFAVLGQSIRLVLPKSSAGQDPSLQDATSMLPTGVLIGGLSDDWLSSVGLGIAISLAISLVATLLGWLTAWHLLTRSPRSRRRWLMLAFVPMVMPAAISYAGWWLLRQPSWPLGDYLAVHASGAFITRLGQATAVLTMALWLWPVTSLLLWLGLRTQSLDALSARLQLAGSRSTQLLAIRMSLGSIGLTMLLAAQLAMASAVSLHLTQLPVPGVDVWARLALDPTLQAGWPGGLAWITLCLITALITVLLTLRHILHPSTQQETLALDHTSEVCHRITPGSSRWVTYLAIACGVLIPLLSSLFTLRKLEFLHAFWREHGWAVVQSLQQGLLVAGLLTLLTLAWSCVLEVAHRGVIRGRLRLAWLCLIVIGYALAITLAIAPGVLIGQATSTVLRTLWLDRVEPLLIPLSHVCRLAILPMIAAGVLWYRSSRDAMDLRRSLDLSCIMLWRLIWQPGLAVLLMVALAGLLLSMQEIEVTLQVTPPGRRSLSIVMLDMLHMNSVQELASVMVQVLGIATAIALIGAWTISRFGRKVR